MAASTKTTARIEKSAVAGKLSKLENIMRKIKVSKVTLNIGVGKNEEQLKKDTLNMVA